MPWKRQIWNLKMDPANGVIIASIHYLFVETREFSPSRKVNVELSCRKNKRPKTYTYAAYVRTCTKGDCTITRTTIINDKNKNEYAAVWWRRLADNNNGVSEKKTDNRMRKKKSVLFFHHLVWRRVVCRLACMFHWIFQKLNEMFVCGRMGEESSSTFTWKWITI